MREQSEKAGTTIITETVSKLDVSSKPFKYETEWSPGEVHTADAIILATGASARRMGLPGEDTYWQRGISACAVCDGAAFIFRNGRLVVIGGGDSAAEEALYLTKYASQVLVLVRRDKLRASSIMAQRLAKHPKVEILYTSHALQIDGPNDDGNMARIEIQIGPATKLSEKLRDEFKKNDTWKDEKKGFISAQGLFYAIGHEPATALVKGQLDTDSEGYIITKPGTPLTSVEGVFAAGDVQDKKYRQAITSAGELQRRRLSRLPIGLLLTSFSIRFWLHGCVGRREVPR